MRPSLLRSALLVMALACSQSSLATDHNEPDLLSGFFSDRAGSGGDIYGVFAYPSDDGSILNFIYTTAPVPESGRFDPNSFQRAFFAPTEEVRIDGEKFLAEYDAPMSETGIMRNLDPLAPWRAIKAATGNIDPFVRHVLRPIVQSAPNLFSDAIAVNNMPIDQSTFPEILVQWSLSGTWARIHLKNFNLPKRTTIFEVKSNGNETDPSKIEFDEINGIKVFIGARDDPFFADIGGFFRSINWRAALDDNDEFIWKGKPRYKDSGRVKESNDKPKHMLYRDKGQGAYDGKDWREGNNINAVVMQIPMEYIVTDPARHELLRVWVESYLTEEAFTVINR